MDLAGEERLEELSILSLFAPDCQLPMAHYARCRLFSASWPIPQPGTIYHVEQSWGEPSSTMHLHSVGVMPLRHHLVWKPTSCILIGSPSCYSPNFPILDKRFLEIETVPHCVLLLLVSSVNIKSKDNLPRSLCPPYHCDELGKDQLAPGNISSCFTYEFPMYWIFSNSLITFPCLAIYAISLAFMIFWPWALYVVLRVIK